MIMIMMMMIMITIIIIIIIIMIINKFNNTNDQYIIIMLSILLGSKYSKFVAWECDTVINVSNN